MELSKIDSEQPSTMIPTNKSVVKKLFANNVYTDKMVEEQQNYMVTVVEFYVRHFESVSSKILNFY